LHAGDHERRRNSFSGGIAHDDGEAVSRKRLEIVAITSQGAKLAAAGTVIHRPAGCSQALHKSPLDIAGQHPILTYIYHYVVACHFPILYSYVGSGSAKSTGRANFSPKNIFARDVENPAAAPTNS
jgi:hypothetical protein